MRKKKIHLDEDQFDGYLHATCGRASGEPGVIHHIVQALEFDATDPADRCSCCEAIWFPKGQPEWHREVAKKKLAEKRALEAMSKKKPPTYPMIIIDRFVYKAVPLMVPKRLAPGEPLVMIREGWTKEGIPLASIPFHDSDRNNPLLDILRESGNIVAEIN